MSDGASGLPASLRAIAFDFDGVILESGPIKQEGFLALFADRPELHPEILAHHRRHLGVSRFDKLVWIYRELLGRELSPEELAELGRRYSERVVERVLACPAVAGAERLLERISGEIPCFVVSATPQAELERIVEERGLRRHFREVRGTPGAKAAILGELLVSYGLAPGELLMVGDGLSDYLAARQAGVAFVLRQTPEQEELFREIEVERVADLEELGRRLDGRLARAGRAAPELAAEGEAGR